jgi:hypothetical protein
VAGPAEIVERLIDAEDQEAETFRLLTSDAEVRPFGRDEFLHGLPAIERYAAATADERPTLRGFTLYEVGENAIVLTQLGVPRGEGSKRYIEAVSVGWVVTFSDERIARIVAYPSWQEARAAGGLTPEREREATPRRTWRSVLMGIREAAAWRAAAGSA